LRRPRRTRTRAIRCGGPLLVLDRCKSCLQSRQRGVASTYVVFDMPTICFRPVTCGACVCRSSRANPLRREPHRPHPPAPRSTPYARAWATSPPGVTYGSRRCDPCRHQRQSNTHGPVIPAGSISTAYRKPHTCWQHHASLTGGVTYTLCLFALAAVFVSRALRIRARRRRERARARAQLRRTEALPTRDRAGDGRPPRRRPCRGRSEPASVNLHLVSLLPLAVISIGWLSLRIAGLRAASA
jgi:hypothetical protein